MSIFSRLGKNEVKNSSEFYNEKLGLNVDDYEIKDDILYLKKFDFALPNSKYLNEFKAVDLGIYYDSKKYKEFVDNNKDITIYFSLPVNAFLNEDKKFLFSKEDEWTNVYFVYEDVKYSIKDIKKIENVIDLMIKDIKDSNLSNYEKYLCAYDIVKSFKTYKENEHNYSLSRALYNVIVSDDIVCVGYSFLLSEFLTRMNIISDAVKTEDHELVITYIKDEKYNIDGFYVGDPTSDSINDKYTMNPLLEKYNKSDLTIIDALKKYNIKGLTRLLDVNPDSMMEFLNSNEKYKKLVLASEYSPMNIFNNTINLFNKRKYNKKDTYNFIKYIQDRVDVKIKREEKLRAIYNINKFVLGDNNVNYFDLIVSNFNIRKQYEIVENMERYLDIYSKLKNINVFDTSMNIIISTIKKSSEFFGEVKIHDDLVTCSILYERDLYHDGVAIYGNKILLSNSFVPNGCEELKFDSELNNYYVDIDDTINNMTYGEFRDYLIDLLYRKRNRHK